MIFFEIDTALPLLQGMLLYVQSEHSIDFESSSHNALTSRTSLGGSASLSVGTLQIEVAIDTGYLMYPWGYHPSESWCRQPLPPVVVRSAGVRCVPNAALVAGVGYDITESGNWSTFYDDATGWLCVTDQSRPLETVEVFEFATSVAASFDGNRLTGLWLKPVFVLSR